MINFIAFLLCLFMLPTVAQAKDESVYDRVMRTGTIKCGYLSWKDFVDIDPNTEEFSGIVVEYMEALGKNLGLKVEWDEEIGRGDYIPALDTGRFDAYCTALTVTAERARMADFVTPFSVSVHYVYVQDGVYEYDQDMTLLNNEDIRFVATEGEVFTKIIRESFPKAKLIELPQATNDADPLVYLATKKVDAIVMNAHITETFIKNNPDKIRRLPTKNPIRSVPLSISTRAGEYRFTKMLDNATRELLYNGTIDSILDRYDPTQKGILRIHKPYEK